MQVCVKITRYVRTFLFSISALLIAVATALATLNAIVRFAGKGFTWSEELCSYCIVLMVYLAIPYLEGAGDQLCISAIDLWVKGKTGQRILNYIRGIITSVIMVVLGYLGLDVMMKAFKRNQVTYVLQMPKGVLYAIAMICIVVALVVWVVLMLCNKGDFDHDNA